MTKSKNFDPKPLQGEHYDEAKKNLVRLAEDNPNGKTDFYIEWCKLRQIDIKTLKKWLDTEQKDKLRQKQRIRIEAALNQEFTNVQLVYINLKKENNILFKLFTQFNGLIIEAIINNESKNLTKDINEIKTITKNLENLAYNCKEEKTDRDSQKTSNDVDRFLKIAENCEMIQNECENQNLSLYLGIIPAFFFKDNYNHLRGKKIFILMVSNLNSQREGVAPKDQNIKPNFSKIIELDYHDDNPIGQ